jgi:hypothetical protein
MKAVEVAMLDMGQPILLTFPNLKALLPLMIWTQMPEGSDPQYAWVRLETRQHAEQLAICSPISASEMALDGTLAKYFARKDTLIAEMKDRASAAASAAVQKAESEGLPLERQYAEGDWVRDSMMEQLRYEMVMIPGSLEMNMEQEALKQIKACCIIEGNPELAESAVTVLEELPFWKE